jgi:hypothetical protein
MEVMTTEIQLFLLWIKRHARRKKKFPSSNLFGSDTEFVRIIVKNED